MAPRRQKPSGFGTKLRELRDAAGLTQKELGERVGVPYQNVARIERGAVEPTWPTVLKLAAALGVEPNAFKATDPGD